MSDYEFWPNTLSLVLITFWPYCNAYSSRPLISPGVGVLKCCMVFPVYRQYLKAASSVCLLRGHPLTRASTRFNSLLAHPRRSESPVISSFARPSNYRDYRIHLVPRTVVIPNASDSHNGPPRRRRRGLLLSRYATWEDSYESHYTRL